MNEEFASPSAGPAPRGGVFAQFVPTLPLLAGILAFLDVVVKGRELFHGPDVFFHIAAGQWMFAHGMLPSHDPFPILWRVRIGSSTSGSPN